MFQTINGWTKYSMVLFIKTNFKGASRDGSTCFYRHPDNDGRKCAVGLFIPDDKYEGSMEQKSATTICGYFPSLQSLMPLDPITMEKFQNVHDNEDLDDDEVLDAMIEWINENVEA